MKSLYIIDPLKISLGSELSRSFLRFLRIIPDVKDLEMELCADIDRYYKIKDMRA